MISRVKYFPILIITGLSYFACKQERQACLTPKTAVLNVEAMHIPSPGAPLIDTIVPVPIFSPLAAGQPTHVLFPAGAAYTLSLSPDADTASWEFITDTAAAAGVVPDTLTFYYQRRLQFISNACGYTFFYSVDSLHTTHHNIDSFKILNGSVTNNVNTKHLQVYLHPDY